MNTNKTPIQPEPTICRQEQRIAYILSLMESGTTAEEFIKKLLKREPPLPFIEQLGKTTCLVVTFDSPEIVQQWLKNINDNKGQFNLLKLGQFCDTNKEPLMRTATLTLKSA